MQRLLALWFEDRDADRTRTDQDYAQLFPGHERAVLQGLRVLRGGGTSDPTTGAPAGTPAGPRTIGHFRLLEVLGSGGQGVVYLAEDLRLGRRVALKLLTSYGGAAGPQELERLRREAAIASKLRHPGICPVYDVQLEGETPYLVLAFLEGETLGRRIRAAREAAPAGGPHPSGSALRSAPPGGPGDVAWSVRLVEKVARALHAAHEAGVVHRDVKPGNVMIGPDGEPVILDFGLARSLEGEMRQLTMTGGFVGTLAYTAPELLRGDAQPHDRRSDVYALGATLHETLTLELPFPGPTQSSMLAAILSGQVPDPRDRHAGVDAALAAIVMTALDYDPARRYQTAEALAEDLRRHREGRPVLVRPAGPVLRLRRWAGRHRALAAALGGLLVTLSAGLGTSLALLGRTQSALTDRQAAINRLQAEQERRQIAYDEVRLRDLPREAEELWPAIPENVTRPGGMDAWLAEARRLQDRDAHYRGLLDELVARGAEAPPEDGYARRLDRERKRTAIELGEATLKLLDDEPKAVTVSRERVESELLQLRRELAERPALRFAAPDDRERYRSLVFLCEKLAGLEAEVRRMTERRKSSLEVGERLERDAEAWRRVDSVRAKDPRTAALATGPEPGLVPLGPDPESGLEEFAAFQTGWIPERSPEGKLLLGPNSAVVFVMVPGGRFEMGAPAGEEGAYPEERPVHAVELDAFLIAKHEMTQGQWKRMTGKEPSGNASWMTIAGRKLDDRHPVEQVSWVECRRVFDRFLMKLPTEAQWEYAARAGGRGAFGAGSREEDLKGVGNIADLTASRQPDARAWRCTLTVEDGHYVTSPVGSFRANAFGLHDVIGNVTEWCEDNNSSYRAPARAGDGLRLSAGFYRLARGGNFSVAAAWQRLAFRHRYLPDFVTTRVGVRPVWRWGAAR